MLESTLKSYVFASFSDEDLAAASQKGDTASFQELMTRYMNPIYNFVRQYARVDEDTEDITQDAFLKAWKHIDQFKKGKPFKPWMYTIARNTALDYIKKKHASAFSALDDTENDLSFADTLHDPEPLPPEVFDRAKLAQELVLALSNIPADHQAVMMMHYRDEMTFDEIALVVGKPMNTVKSWHRRALIRLRELLAAKP